MHLELHQLGVRYPGRPRPAVDGVSLGLRAGDIGVLIGPSGCGKTTLLRDEPFSTLDVDLRERLAHEVRGILKAAQATALFVTHDQLEAFAIGDRIGVMHEGHLHQWDDAYTLYHRPATRFVADFIGHGVFAPATLKRVGNQVVVHTDLGALTDGAECPLPNAFGW